MHDGRWGQEWRALVIETHAQALAAFGLPYPIDPESDSFAASLAITDLGLCRCPVIAEPRLRRDMRKLSRDAELGRDTIHAAPTWRYPDADETGMDALILPVMCDFAADRHRTLSLHACREEEFKARIIDLVALPLDCSRPLSRTGHTLAIGPFNLAGERLVLHAGGKAWLEVWLDQVRAVTADTPPHLVPRLHFPLPPPDDAATLLVEPEALDWRVTSGRCIIPHAADKVLVPDSVAVARYIDGAMRQRERARPLPQVLGPAVTA
jgi:hypothetical protein